MPVLRRLRAMLDSLLGGEAGQYRRQLPPGDPRRTDSLVAPVEDGEALVRALVEGGVLVEQGEDVVLSTGFRDSWREQMTELRGMDEVALSRAVTSTAPGVEHAAVTEDEGRSFVVVGRGDDQLWVSRPVALAELGAMRALPETVAPDHRLAAPRPLRLFLEECPDCRAAWISWPPRTGRRPTTPTRTRARCWSATTAARRCTSGDSLRRDGVRAPAHSGGSSRPTTISWASRCS